MYDTRSHDYHDVIITSLAHYTAHALYKHLYMTKLGKILQRSSDNCISGLLQHNQIDWYNVVIYYNTYIDHRRSIITIWELINYVRVVINALRPKHKVYFPKQFHGKETMHT